MDRMKARVERGRRRQEIGSRLRMLRRESGITQAILAKKVQVSQQMIGHIETGQKAMVAELCYDICKAIGCSTDDIIVGKTA